jgi:hypothetical protein
MRRRRGLDAFQRYVPHEAVGNGPHVRCHEHTPANIRAEHKKEGIRDFESWVECHRDPGIEPEKSGRSGAKGRAEKD